MAFSEIALINIPKSREDGSDRNFEFRILERDSAGEDLDFDLYGEFSIETGNRGDGLDKPIKPSVCHFNIKTRSALAGKLISADPRQYFLTVRETVSNTMKFEGFIKPDYQDYSVYDEVQTVQLKATGELASLSRYNAIVDKKSLKELYDQVNTELEITRDTDFYMRTRYDGQALSDPIPQRIWATELGLIGEEEGDRYAAIKQLSQQFNFQVFQENGRLVVADTYERFQNPTVVNKYTGGTTHGTENVLVDLGTEKSLRKAGGRKVSPTGKRAKRVGRVFQQRRLPQREQSSFPSQTLPKVLSGTPYEIAYPGDFVGGDIVKIDEIAGTAEITPGYQPDEYPNTITVDFEMLQFEFVDKDTDESLYYDFEEREWADSEKWGNQVHQYFELAESQQEEGQHYLPFSWSFPVMELAPIPEERRGSITIRLKEDYTIQQAGVDVDPGYMDTKLTDFFVPITFNDTPDNLYHQGIATNAPGETRVYPLYESDITDYSGEEGTLFIGEDVFQATPANNEWIQEGTANLVPFIELTARRKAELMLGSSDRIHLVVRDTTPISLLNIILFEGTYYAPVCIREQLKSGYQEIWMKPAPGLEYSYDEQFTYDPEEITASTGSGASRNWVTNRISDAFSTSLATGAIAKTTAATGSGLVTALQIDRQNLLTAGDEIFVVDPFTLNRYEFEVSEDQGASFTLFLEPKSVPGPIPTGSFVFSSARDVVTGVLQSKYAFEVFSESSGLGVLTEDVSGQVSQLPVNLWGWVRNNWVLDLPLKDRAKPTTVTVSGAEESYDAGPQNLPIREQVVNAPAGTVLKMNGTFLSSLFHVDPGQIKAMVEREKKADAIGTLSADRSGAGVTTIPLQDIDEDVQMLDGQKLRILNKEGKNEEIVVNGDQLLVAPADTLNIVSKDLTHTYTAGYGWVREATYKLTGRLTIEAGRIDATVQNTTDNSNAIAGLTLDVQDNESAIATLQARVTTTENDISGLEDEDTQLNAAILDLEADLDSATASLTASIDILEDDTRTIIRQNSAPSQRPSGDPLETGDLWIETDDNDEAHVWDGNSWEPFDGKIKSQVAGLINQVGNFDTDDFQQYEDQIGTIGARSVLFTNDNGNISSIELLSGDEGAVIDISADQVNINGIVLDDGAGLIRSSDFNATNETGWRLVGGSGSFLQIYNIELWGTLEDVEQKGDMVVTGAIYIPSKSSPDVTISSTVGISIKADSSYNASRSLSVEESGVDRLRIFGNSSINEAVIDCVGGWGLWINSGDYIRLKSNTYISLDAETRILCDAPFTLKNYTRSEILGISPALSGMIVWNTTAGRGAYYDGSDWRNLNSGSTI